MPRLVLVLILAPLLAGLSWLPAGAGVPPESPDHPQPLVRPQPLDTAPSLKAAPSLQTPEPRGSWPLRPDPEVVRGFDPPHTPWGAGHRGVDLLGAAGQAVRAALPGTVTYAGLLAGRGVVVVSHGTTRTTYEPVAAAVAPGAHVAAGERLGSLQDAPSHCAPRVCLHWGWLKGATYLDPLRLVGLGPVRLLPLSSALLQATATGPLGPVAAHSPRPSWW